MEREGNDGSDASSGGAPLRTGFGRRAFLALGISGAVAALVGGGSWLLRSGEDLIANLVRTDLPGLDIPDAELSRFAREFLVQDHHGRRFLFALHGLRVTGVAAFSDSVRPFMPAKAVMWLEKYEREVLTAFMLSTNFFETYARGKKGVRYLGFYDPLARPCQYSLARFE